MTKREISKLFEDKKIRTVWDDKEEKWYFSAGQGTGPWFTIIKPSISSQIFPFDSKNRRIIWRKKIKSLFLQYHCF